VSVESPLKKVFEDKSMMVESLHVNGGKSPFKNAIYHQSEDGGPEQQMLKLKQRLYVDKGDRRAYDDCDEEERHKKALFANWGSTKMV